jgi:hypothetical protein
MLIERRDAVEQPGDRGRTPEAPGRINRAFLTPDRANTRTEGAIWMFVFRKMSLVVKLARRGSFHGSDGRHDLRDPRKSHEKARKWPNFRPERRLRVFEESSLAGNSDAVVFSSPPAGHSTATLWDGSALRVEQDTLDRISDVTGARLTFFTYESKNRPFFAP